jgi:phosphoglycerate dehydrogenase-like enzyme
MKLLLLVQHPFALWQAPDWFVARLRSDFPQLELAHLTSYQDIARELPTSDVFVGWSLKPEQLALARKLRWIHSPAAAVHALMSPELATSSVVVTNARSVHGPVVAEHALALMLALAKRIPQAVRYQEQKTWSQQLLWDQTPRPRELAGSTLALVGYGAIGREVARLAAAFQMRVLVVREHPDGASTEYRVPSTENDPDQNRVEEAFRPPSQASKEHAALAAEVQTRYPVLGTQYSTNQLDQVLTAADFVVLAAPLTEKTRGLISAARLAKMKRDAYLINVSRGPLIDDAALTAALREGRIGGAALDVFEKEPLPADSPYYKLPNVLITPHSASLTERLWERHYALLSENLRRFLSDQPLLGLVDKHAGY